MSKIVSILAGSLAALAAIPVLAGVTAPPAAPIEVVADDYFGTRVEDPYRWMESGKDPRWIPWLKGQSLYARQTLDAIPGRAAMLADAARLSGDVARVGSSTLIGQTLFFNKRPPGAEDPRLFVRQGRAKPRLLFDVNVYSKGKLALDYTRVAPDGRTIALGLSPRGTENSTVFLLDVATGKVTDTGITQANVTTWLPDSSGFSYIRMIGTAGQPDYFVNVQPRFHSVRSGQDVLLVSRDASPVPATPQQRLAVAFAPQGNGALMTVCDGRNECAVYTTDAAQLIAGKASWRRVADFPDLIVNQTIAGDRLWLLSRKGDGNGRILLTSVANPDLAKAKAIALPGNPVINYITALGGQLLVEAVGPGGQTALWRVWPDGRTAAVAMPLVGSGYVNPPIDGKSATVALTGWFAPNAQYQLGTSGPLTDLGLADKSPFDPGRYEAQVLEAVARDGVKVPYTVIARKGLKLDGKNPVLLEAYGSYGIVMSPYYQSQLIPFLDRGGVYVLAAVRGGGEYGRAWHEAGRAKNKATTWRDAIDVAETLIKTRLTAKQHLAIIGTSAGGVMVGGAVNERPDLFAAAIANVAFMNPVRYVSEQNFADIEEWGGPIQDADSFQTMFGLDAYNHIKPGTAYPAVLVVSGINDPRAATFHGAKYAARVAAATTSGQPVLLRIDFDAGHGMGSGRSQIDATWADIFSFVLWKTGAPGFQP